MAAPGITLTATLEDITGAAAGSTANPAWIEVVLNGYGLTLPQIVGTATIAQIVKKVISSGAPISMSLWGNYQVTPAGTWYEITVYDGSNNIVQTGVYQFPSAGVFDLSSLTQVYPVPPSAPGLIPVYTNLPGTPTQTINGDIIIDGNLIVTGSISGGGLYVVPVVATVAEFDAGEGLTQSLTLTENTTSTIANMPTGALVNFLIKQNGTGNWTFAWPAGWSSAPRVNPAANSATRVSVLKDENAAIWFWPSAIAGVNFDNLPVNTSDVAVATTAESASWRQLDQDDITPGFTITSFIGGGTVEIGATVTNPAFTAAYSALPTSAQITNTDGIDSPLALTTPFTSGTVVGSFHHTAAATVTFTLTAVETSTETATRTLVFAPLTFGGVGTAGATGATAGVNTAVLVGATGTLANSGFNNQATYGPYTAASQKIYVLMIGASHTFKDATTGFAFPMLAPTSVSFVNQQGATVAMSMYESANPVIGTVTLNVAT